MSISAFELQRALNIEKNRPLLEEAAQAGRKVVARPAASTAKPIQSARERKRKLSEVENAPRRQSTRLRGTGVDPNESPSKRKKREEELEAARREEELERIAQEERDRVARQPRHHSLDLGELGRGEQSSPETEQLLSTLKQAGSLVFNTETSTPYNEDSPDQSLEELKKQFKNMTIVSRAKVTLNRVYSAAYHSDNTKDLIFFGDKHGQLGIWDARAVPEDKSDESETETAGALEKEGGKIYRLQPHWPATSKSSISCLKLDPLDSQKIYSLSYDSTLRRLSFETGVSDELLSWEDGSLPCSMDFSTGSHVVWVSDDSGRASRVDIRAPKSEVMRWTLSAVKIGSISINPVNSNAVLCASNDRSMRIWDVRKLDNFPLEVVKEPQLAYRGQNISVLASDEDTPLTESSGDKIMRGYWEHGRSVSSAYWSPSGDRIVSTSYDDTLRLWKLSPSDIDSGGKFRSMRPLKEISHNCQTGKWLTILRAQWSPNRDVHPHFTIGNMNHALDVYSGQGELVARLSDRTKITAVQAVTCSSPNTITRVATGNASGRCVLWDVSSAA